MVFCEGAVTEPRYLDALKRVPDVRDVAAIDIRIDSSGAGCAPLTMVKRAHEAMTRSENVEVDEYWCVFDVECPKPHPDLAAATRLAKRHGIHLAISNPCFELWLILHHQDQTAWLDTATAQSLWRQLNAVRGKDLDGEVQMQLRHTAAERAAALADRHVRNDSGPPQDNPSSGMYLLLRSVEPPD